MIVSIVQIVENKKLSSKYYKLKFIAGESFKNIIPGQFLNIKISDNNFPLLRRPFSISDYDGETVTILYDVVGLGTEILVNKKPGDLLDVLGPLGNGYKIDNSKNYALVFGGIGVAPYPLLKRNLLLHGLSYTTLIGGRDKASIESFGNSDTICATEDGSYGSKGNVITLLESIIHEGRFSEILACGPYGMLKAIKDFGLKHNIKSQLSLESHMACGIGLCQGCPIQSATKEDKYLLICKDGPVFNAEDVVL